MSDALDVTGRLVRGWIGRNFISSWPARQLARKADCDSRNDKRPALFLHIGHKQAARHHWCLNFHTHHCFPSTAATARDARRWGVALPTLHLMQTRPYPSKPDLWSAGARRCAALVCQVCLSPKWPAFVIVDGYRGGPCPTTLHHVCVLKQQNFGGIPAPGQQQQQQRSCSVPFRSCGCSTACTYTQGQWECSVHMRSCELPCTGGSCLVHVAGRSGCQAVHQTWRSWHACA